ncbi:MAG: hypothetical protein IIX75_04625 [Clostridia bacterium]|nr:hypothetical protein [Clostridia bacterium]
MNCLCNLFEDSTVWLIIIAAILLFNSCNGCGCVNTGCGCGNNGCGCANSGCGCN